MSDSELTLRITGDASGVQEAADQAKEQIDRATQSVSMLGDLIGVKVPEGVQKMLASTDTIGPALDAAFEPLAVLQLSRAVADASDKVSKLIGDTFIYTDAQKQEYQALVSANQALAASAERVKQLDREYQIAAAKTAAAKDELRLKFKLEDLGGDPKALKDKLEKAIADWKQAMRDLAALKPEGSEQPFDSGASIYVEDTAGFEKNVEKAKAKIAGLENTILQLNAALKESQAASKVGTQAIQADFESTARNVADFKTNVLLQVHAATLRAEQQNLNDSIKFDQENLNAYKDTNDQIIAAANERLQVESTRIQGEIDAAKVAEETKEQLIQQSFLKGQITRQQEIQAVAQAKIDELNQEIKFLREREQLWDGDAKKIAEIENQITKIIEQQKLIRAKADTDALKTEQSNLQKRLKDWQDVNKQMENSYLQMMDSMNSALLDFVKTGKFNWQQMATQMIDDILRVASQWAESQILMKVLGIQSSKETAGSGILDSAAAGAAAAGASVAAIPVVGWTMVEPVAAATYTQLAAYAAGLAAHYDLGGVVPATGFALVHQGEKILPRSMSGTGAGLGGPAVHVHVNLNAIDADSFRGTIARHGNIIGNEVAKVLRKKGFYSG